jgi:hypothetical protein
MEPPTPRRTLRSLAGRSWAALQSRHPPTAHRRPRPRLIPSAADPLRSGPKSGIPVRRRHSRPPRPRLARSGRPAAAEALSLTVQTFPPLAMSRVARTVPAAVLVAPVAVEAGGVVAAPAAEDQAVPVPVPAPEVPAAPADPAATSTGGRTVHAARGGSQLPDPGQQRRQSHAASAPAPALPAAPALLGVAGVSHSEPAVGPPPSWSTPARRNAPRRTLTPSAPPGNAAANAAASPSGAT